MPPDIATDGPVSGPHTTQDERRALAAYARAPRSLTPHPWDALGQPQPLDDPDDPMLNAQWTCLDTIPDAGHNPPHRFAAECVAALEKEAKEHERDAEYHREEAYDEESAADECRELIRDLKKAAHEPLPQPPVPGQMPASL